VIDPRHVEALAKFPGYRIYGFGREAMVCHASKTVWLFFEKDAVENAFQKGCRHGAIHELTYIDIVRESKRDVYGVEAMPNHSYNPIRFTMALPHDVQVLDDIIWSPNDDASENDAGELPKQATERTRASQRKV
jgi:hypothetical protein